MDQKFECDVIIKTEPNNEDHNLLLTLPYKCHICEKSFKSQRFRSKHIKTLHEDTSYHSNTDIMIKKEPKIEDLPLSKFELEGGTTNSISNLTASEIINLRIKPFKCEDCDYSSSRKGDLKKHISSQHAKHDVGSFDEGKVYTCEICNSEFKDRSNLKKHILVVHEGIKPFECSLCGSCFSQKSKMKKHIAAVHERKKPHKCKWCDRGFDSKKDLTRHIECVHEKKRPFKCEMCGQDFGMACSLKKHVKTMHEDGNSYIIDTCPVCSKHFKYKTALENHMKKVHQSILPNEPQEYRCQICFDGFYHEEELHLHNQTEHETMEIQELNPLEILEVECDIVVNEDSPE